VPLLIEATPYNSQYLATKAKKLGHLLLKTYLATLALQWRDVERSVSEQYQRLDRIRTLAQELGLLVQEETRPVATAVFGRDRQILQLGFDQQQETDPLWHQQPEHPHCRALIQLLQHLSTWVELQTLEFLLSDGSDSFTGLQGQLQRQSLTLADLVACAADRLKTQRIYQVTLVDG